MIATIPYSEQQQIWPTTGRHILAHYDAETILVYQAYCPAIGRYAIDHGCFGGDFRYSRMSWIKPNFLWMMYRSDWGRSEGQDMVLAIRLRRSFFDQLLTQAVASGFGSSDFDNPQEWKEAVSNSDVRLQWDPDHLPTGEKCERRAIQLGLRGEALEAFGKEEALEIIDISGFVAEQRIHASQWRSGNLMTPAERVYVPMAQDAATNVGLTPVDEHRSSVSSQD